MDALVANIAHPPTSRRNADGDEHSPETWGSMGGFGNLDASGAVSGMTVPAVPDVSQVYGQLAGRWIAVLCGD